MSDQTARAFRTLRAIGESELEIKRSRFLGQAEPLRDEAATQTLLARVRAQHPDASHHAFVYRIGHEGEIARFSDDGEPGGTAGRPIMEVLLREAVVDAMVVVTRYFGGTLLGAGGLTRAYGQAAAEAVRAAGCTSMRPHTLISATVDYAQYGALEQALLRIGLAATDTHYTDTVCLTVPVPSGQEHAFGVLVADLTAGAGRVAAGRTIYLPE